MLFEAELPFEYVEHWLDTVFERFQALCSCTWGFVLLGTFFGECCFERRSSVAFVAMMICPGPGALAWNRGS
jgi:hypothetical protein